MAENLCESASCQSSVSTGLFGTLVFWEFFRLHFVFLCHYVFCYLFFRIEQNSMAVFGINLSTEDYVDWDFAEDYQDHGGYFLTHQSITHRWPCMPLIGVSTYDLNHQRGIKINKVTLPANFLLEDSLARYHQILGHRIWFMKQGLHCNLYSEYEPRVCGTLW